MKLYELAAEFAAIMRTIDDGEISDDIGPQLDACELAIESKLENCCRLLRNLEAEAAARYTEARRLRTAAEHFDNHVIRLKAYMMRCLQTAGIGSINAGVFRLRIQANSVPSVHIDVPLADLPLEYVTLTPTANTTAIKEAAANGQPLPNGVRVERGQHLRIS